jgi:hypothetical protein
VRWPGRPGSALAYVRCGLPGQEIKLLWKRDRLIRS